MDKLLEGRLVKFAPGPKDADEVTLTFQARVTPIDYADLARLYNQPGTIMISTLQTEFKPKVMEDGTEQLSLEDAALAVDGMENIDDELAEIDTAALDRQFSEVAEVDIAETTEQEPVMIPVGQGRHRSRG